MRLTPNTSEALIDEPLTFAVSDTAASAVDLRVTCTDHDGKRWESVNTYTVGPDGVLLIRDPDQPWTTMAFMDTDKVPVIFSGCDTGGGHRALFR